MFSYILRAIRAGRCREQRYADHIFIQICFRMHHFVVKFSKKKFASGGKGALTPPIQNPADPAVRQLSFRSCLSTCLVRVFIIVL